MQTRWHRWALASLLVHASLLGVVARAAPRRAELPTPAYVTFDIAPGEAPADPTVLRSERAGQPHPDAEPMRIRPGGAASAQNISAETAGERGDGQSLDPGRNLAARAEGVNLDARALNTLHETQEQRIRTARHRASPQDDRRTPHPDDDPWVSTGGGILLARMPVARALPGEGVTMRAGVAETAGDADQNATAPDTQNPGDTAQRTAGATARLAAGVADRRIGAARVAGPVATQRPSLEQGHASTTADDDALRPSDDRDAALLAASLLRAHVSATVQQGVARGDGVGGVGGGGAPGSGGAIGRGGRASAIGDGDGVLSIETSDARYLRYFGQVRRRLHQLTEGAFPYEEALRLHQGTVIVEFVIERDGRVRDVAVRRASGVPVYDHNVRDALVSASMPPLPPALGRERLAVRAPVAFLNPVVR